MTYFPFIQTPVFVRRAEGLITDDDLRNLEKLLMENPERGELIQGSGGCRKIRLNLPSRKEGKRGGARVIYYWLPDKVKIYFLLVYDKHSQDDLDSKEKKALKQLVSQLR